MSCVCAFFCFFWGVPVFIGLWAFASRNMSVTLSVPFCMYACMSASVRASLSCMPVILGMPLKLHMTSI